MIDATDLERLRAAGFTEPQISAPADTIHHATRDLVTRDHLDLRLVELREHIDSGFGRQKTDLLRWMFAFQVVAALGLYLAIRYGG